MSKYRVKVSFPEVPDGTRLDVPDLGGAVANGESKTVELDEETAKRMKESYGFEVKKAGKEESDAD